MNKKIKTLLLTLMFAFTITLAGIALADALNAATDEGKITVNKNAVVDPKDNRKANVSLSISGNKITKTKTLDVVLVIDRSTSMNDPVNEDDEQTRMEATKVAANSLVTKLLSNNTADRTVVKMGIVTFGTNVINSYRHYTGYNNYETLYVTSSSLSGDANAVKTLINNIPNHINGAYDDMDAQGTNVQSGLERAGLLLKDSNASEKIIILLSDGQPNLFNYEGSVYGNGQDDSSVCVEGFIICSKYMQPSVAAKNTATALKTATDTNPAMTIYTVGYGLGNDTTTKAFLRDVATSADHAFVADKTSELEGKFNDIVNDITTIASDAVVTDIVPAGFTLDEALIKETYGEKVEVINNQDGTTTIKWLIGDIQSIKDENLSYSVVAKDDNYGAMYTNVSAVLKAKTTDNPAYPSGNITETFSKPIVAIAMKTNNDNYSAKLGEKLVVNVKNGILDNDSTNKMTDGEGSEVTNEIIVKSVSCGDINDITVNSDGSFTYMPNSSCYVNEDSKVTFDYVVKSKVTINGEKQVVTSNTSTITIDLTKDDASVDNPTVTKTNNNGSTTESITDSFSYTINYSAVIENHVGSTKLTIVDKLPYELDETKTNNLDGGTYDKESKTITWVVELKDIDSYNNKNNSINVEKTIEVFYKNVPTDVESIINTVEVITDIDNIPVNGENETVVEKGNLVVEYVDNLGNKLLSDVTSNGLVGSEYATSADSVITKDNIEYKLVATKVNNTLVDKTNSYRGSYVKGSTTVTYVYYKVTGDIDKDQTIFTKVGTKKVISSNGEFNYTITYKSKIDNYIGNAVLTIVDRLPFEVDTTKTYDFAGGSYNAQDKTITWVVNINDIDTYSNGTYSVNVEKAIKVVFKGIDANERLLTNNVEAKLETSKSSLDNKAKAETELAINGNVVAKYVDINNKKLVDDYEDSGLVGNDYVTSAKNIEGYKLVEVRGNSTGKFIDGTVNVTYVYYEIKGSVTGDKFTKTGTTKVTSIDAKFEYEITYTATINDYIGDAIITIVDKLPLEIDTTKFYDLNGGEYDAVTKTITWVVEVKDIDTNKNGAYPVSVTRNISLHFKDLDPTVREISNSVEGSIKTSVGNVNTDSDSAETTVEVSGNVVSKYVDTNGNVISADVKTTGLVGDSYTTSAETIDNYQLVRVDGNTTGTYTLEDIEVVYVYYRVEGNIDTNIITKTGTEEVNSTDSKFNYVINYKTVIKNYIGDATLTIVDKLPLEIDTTKDYSLDGGIYDAATKTITWVIEIKDIDTNTNGDNNIDILKNISLSYKGLLATSRKVTNEVVATIKTSVGEETTNPAIKETLVKVYGDVIAKYVDTDGNVISADVKTTGLVGDSYTTSAETIDNYQLVRVDGNVTGTYTLEDIVVTYVYYRETGEISGDEISKLATEEVTSTNANFEYTITYKATIKNYIGNASVTIIDTLPLEIDTTKEYNLDGGIYDAATKTITWVVSINDIDTNVNGNKVVEVTKNINLSYKNLDATTREVTNSVVGSIKTDVTNKTTEPKEATTAVRVSGKVITHFVDVNGNSISEDVLISDLVGNNYITSAKKITNYELVDTIGNTTGTYTLKDIEVTYVYYKETGDITGDIVEKEGNEEITDKDEKVNYTINYKANIDNYIGNASLTIVDYLPCAIDLTASDLAGGIYDEENATITWNLDLLDINTYINGTYKINITKEIVLTYKDLDLSTDTITNNVEATVKTEKSEKTSEDGFETEVDVKGNVIVNYVDDNGNKIAESTVLTGKVGTVYETEAKEFIDYELINVIGDTTGEYTYEENSVTYVYALIGKGGDVEELPPQTGVNNNNTLLLEFISTLVIGLFLIIKRNI